MYHVMYVHSHSSCPPGSDTYLFTTEICCVYFVHDSIYPYSLESFVIPDLGMVLMKFLKYQIFFFFFFCFCHVFILQQQIIWLERLRGWVYLFICLFSFSKRCSQVVQFQEENGNVILMSSHKPKHVSRRNDELHYTVQLFGQVGSTRALPQLHAQIASNMSRQLHWINITTLEDFLFSLFLWSFSLPSLSLSGHENIRKK